MVSKALAVGDIHTKIDTIVAIEKIINKYDYIIFVGDYADDWNKTALSTIETWKSLISLQKRYPQKVKCVIGNHDYAYILGHDPRSGGYSTITQTIIDVDYPEIKKWLTFLPIVIEIDGVYYSHAGINEDWNDSTDKYDLWQDDSPLWIRPISIAYGWKYRNVPQVFGHTPSQTCWEVQENVWCIDTMSTYRDGTPIGDKTMLEIINGTSFNVVSKL